MSVVIWICLPHFPLHLHVSILLGIYLFIYHVPICKDEEEEKKHGVMSIFRKAN